MPGYTYPNQRIVHIHRESAKSNFLGIKNDNWQAASRDLGPYGLQLYLYLAANANNYSLALSPAALQQDIGLKRSTYRDHFTDLVNKGYLVQGTGNTWEFYERPQVRDIANNGLNQNEMAATANQIDEKACDALNAQQGADSVSGANTEINNMPIVATKSGINNRVEFEKKSLPCSSSVTSTKKGEFTF